MKKLKNSSYLSFLMQINKLWQKEAEENQLEEL
jgi:hypothetical protein